MPVSKKSVVTQPKIYGIGSKFKQFIYTLVFHYMSNVRILAKAVLQISGVKKTGVPQPKNYGIGSKVNQFIYTLVYNYTQNIRILAKAFFQLFCSQGCSYTKCLCLKKGNKPTENFGIGSKDNQFIYTLVCNLLYAKYQNPSKSGSSDILFTRLFLYKMPVSKKSVVTQPKIYGIGSIVKQFIYNLV